MNLNLYKLWLYAIVSLLYALAVSCDNDEPAPQPDPPSGRTVLVYMVANNNLGSSGYDDADIKEMLKAAEEGAIGADGRLLVYHAGFGTQPELFEITQDGIVRHVLYDDAEYSVSQARMREVIADTRRIAPAAEYGLVLWSHASGWLQDGISEPERDIEETGISSYAFGQDRGHTMNITSLAEVLAGGDFDFIYFDCCYMASVEVAYELRNATHTIIGSSTELISDGMRYDLNIPMFFRAGSPDLIGAARNTFEYYDGMFGMMRTCTMSVISTAGLDRLAAATRRIYSHAGIGLPEGYEPQVFMEKSVASCYHFDFRDYVAALALGAAGDSEQWPGAASDLADFDDALADVVLYSASTPKLWNRILLDRVCGLSSYILMNNGSVGMKNYNTLGWYADVASALN